MIEATAFTSVFSEVSYSIIWSANSVNNSMMIEKSYCKRFFLCWSKIKCILFDNWHQRFMKTAMVTPVSTEIEMIRDLYAKTIPLIGSVAIYVIIVMSSARMRNVITEQNVTKTFFSISWYCAFIIVNSGWSAWNETNFASKIHSNNIISTIMHSRNSICR